MAPVIPSGCPATSKRSSSSSGRAATRLTGSDTYYFRYYTGTGQEHELERVMLPQLRSPPRAASSYGDPVGHPQNWTGDTQSDLIASYTCFYYEYDADGRVTKEVTLRQEQRVRLRTRPSQQQLRRLQRVGTR